MTNPITKTANEVRSILYGETPSVSAGLITQPANVRNLRAAVMAVPRRDLAMHLAQIIRGGYGQGALDNLIHDLQKEAKP
jgi:hypothetical protein